MPTMFAESLRAFLKPLWPYLDDPEVNEITVVGPTEIWVERQGRLRRCEGAFTEDGLMAAGRNLAHYVGRSITEERPRLDARLPDGSRIHIVMPPISRKGMLIAIRKFSREKLTMARLVEFGSATAPMSRLVEACVKLHQNIVVSGGTGSGKTTLLNVVSRFVDEEERIVTIEDAAELQITQPDLISLESRPADKFGKGEVTLGDLLHSALRLRPDRIVVGEVRGGEAFHLLQAMNTGHSGSLATTHANSPVDTLRRLESLCLMSGIELPMVAVRSQVAAAIHVVVICARFADGSRKISHVSEVLPLSERGEYRTRDLWVFTETGRGPNGKVQGYHAPTGILPGFIDRLAAAGFPDMDERFFDPATWKLAPPPVFTADDVARTRWAPSLRHREAGAAPAPAPAPAPAAAPAAPAAAAAPAAPAPPAPAPAAAPPPPSPAPTAAAPAAAGEDATNPGLPLAEDTPRLGIPLPPPARSDEIVEPRETLQDLPVPHAEMASVEKAHPHAPGDEKPAAVAPVRGPYAKGEEKHAPAPQRPELPDDEPTIQISEDLLEEVERAVVNEQTHIQKNPLLRNPARPAPKTSRGAARKDEEERTDPHIRLPK